MAKLFGSRASFVGTLIENSPDIHSLRLIRTNPCLIFIELWAAPIAPTIITTIASSELNTLQ
ncbi:MAG: hypothetical protein H6695_00460 [Deferribacteres bacterium]|nr:hypothetical protein [candidate division KSB1 bacterium]MCB9508621.1 hypothetical protein [Deferribacteres bacterium]